MSQDIIRLLPDAVANKIAAGEVIQRPASVIKELVENSVDAGATDIRIYIKDAGRTLIQVIDNGKGMTETDARMAFERHATSKISDASDLFTLTTMGFRGEALPSICAVSQVELRTRTEGQEMGTKLVINGSQVETQERCVCERGTNIMVRNIFYNVPARRKFLKSDTVELGHIMREFERLALVNDDKRMILDTGNKVIDLPSAPLKQRIGDIWKNNLNMQLLPVEIDFSMVKLSGYVSRPEHCRRRNALQFMIVNGRNMKHPYFHRAIMSCYEHLIPADSQPCYFIKFEVDPTTIDVNVHPTKNEIKFEYDNEIYRILQSEVRKALGENAAVPSIDFGMDVQQVAPPKPGEFIGVPDNGADPFYNPFTTPSGHNPSGGKSGATFNRKESVYRSTQNHDWEVLYRDFIAKPDAVQPSLPHTEELQRPALTNMCVQYDRKYLILPVREGLMVIDQHRAHVRLLYEDYMSRNTGATASQQVIFAEPMKLDADRSLILENIEDELHAIGFRLSQETEPGTKDASDENIWNVTAVPSSLSKSGDPAKMLINLLDELCDETTPDEAEVSLGLMQRVALAAAKCGAIRGGQRLSQIEMENLVGRLLALPDCNYTPTGNKIINIIPDNLIRFR